MNPLVSVVIPTIPERKRLLERAVKSVKNQTYDNIEIVTVTEGNNACEARNIGIERSNGEFISFLDDDDTWQPTKIEKQVDELLKHTWSPLCVTYSRDLRFDQDRISKTSHVITHNEAIESFSVSSTSTYLVRKQALEEIKEKDGYYFDESLVSAQEYDLALRLSKYEDIITVEDVLVTQYQSENQISENWKKKKKGLKQVYKKHKKDFSNHYITYIAIQSLFTLADIGLGNKIYKIINKVRK